MTVVSTVMDKEALTLTFVAEFAATPEQVWHVWEDRDQLERWWGPPTWPATFTRHDFVVGGRSAYFMTGPDGDSVHGWWLIHALDAPSRLELEDGFADENGNPTGEFGSTRSAVTLEQTGGGTRMTLVGTFTSPEQLEQMLAMGMEEGMREAMGQIDPLLTTDDRF